MSEPVPHVSVIIPALNERGNLAPLVAEIDAALGPRMPFEVIIVDDGSTDGTSEEITSLVDKWPWCNSLRHERSTGQSAAIRGGVLAANAEVIAVLDGDGQNDPADLPTLIGHLEMLPGISMVVGRRIGRQDSWLRKLSSSLANSVRNAVLHDGIKDTGCGLKAFYKSDFLNLPAFDHMHRFLPALVQRSGGRVHCVPVNHRPRLRGKSKYGVRNRLWVGITDLLGVMWLQKRRI